MVHTHTQDSVNTPDLEVKTVEALWPPGVTLHCTEQGDGGQEKGGGKGEGQGEEGERQNTQRDR